MDRILAFSYPVTFPDNQFWITGSSDATKTIKFEVDAQTTGDDLTINSGAQTDDRTVTFPVLTGNRTLAVVDQEQTFTARQSITTTSGNQLDLTGPASSFGDGPDMRLKFTSDADAVFSFFAYSHDNIALVFDAYFTASGWVASDTTAAQIYKVSDKLNFYLKGGLTKGSLYTPDAIPMSIGVLATPTSTTTGTVIIGDQSTASANVSFGGGKIFTGDTVLHHTSVALTNGAGAATGTLLNAPAAGNPTKWIPIDDNGVTRYIPAW